MSHKTYASQTAETPSTSRSIPQNRLQKSRHAPRSIKKSRQDVSLDGVDVFKREAKKNAKPACLVNFLSACVNDFKDAYVNRCETCVWHDLPLSHVDHTPRHPCLICLSYISFVFDRSLLSFIDLFCLS